MSEQEKTQDTLSPDLVVAEVLNRWPETIPVFLKYKLDCVGCDMASFDTLADVIRIYCLPAEQFVNDLRQAILTSGMGEEKG
jgi:hybrid cluster-associated redox disulfide protein